MIIAPRSTIGTPEPPSTRRKLVRVGVLIAHEVGVNTPPSGRYRSADPSRVLADAKAAASFGISSGRPWEYSYMIGLDGSVFTQAGEYMAQHCLNFNQQSAGVLFLNALDVPVNAAQVESWHALRSHMVASGTLIAGHELAPHYRYRATSCPGIRAQPPGGPWESPTGEGRLGNLVPALLDHQQEDPMPREYVATPPPERPGKPWFLKINGVVSYATNFDDGYPLCQLNAEQYDNLYRSVFGPFTG